METKIVLLVCSGWMLAIALIGGLLWFSYFAGKRAQAAINARLDADWAALMNSLCAIEPLIGAGQPGRAQIKHLHGTGRSLQGDDNYVYDVTFVVTRRGAGGAAVALSQPYEAVCRVWIVEEDRARFEPGTEHDVWIDPHNPTRVALPGTRFEVLREMERFRARSRTKTGWW